MKSFAEADAVLATYATGVWVALFTALPALDGSTLPEIAFVGYARQPLVLGAPFTFTAEGGRLVRRRQSATLLTFGPVQAPASGGLVYAGLMSAFEGGWLRRMTAFASALPAPSLGLLTIPAGALAIHEA